MTEHIETRTAPVVEDVEIRTTAIGVVDEQSRVISGIAVPFGQVTEIRTKSGSYRESFVRDVFDDSTEGVSVHANHSWKTRGDLPIGTVVKGVNREDGFYVECRIANTARGDEVLELARDGVLKYFSVGFLPVTHETRDGVIVRTKGALREVSITEVPAYKGAVIESVRNAATEQDSGMTPEELEALIKKHPELAQLRSDNAELLRRVGVLEDADPAAGTGPREWKTRTGGELLKAMFSGNTDAITEIREVVDAIEGERIETRAYTGQVVADGVERPAWIDKQLRLTNKRRPLSTVFSRESLPADGTSFEYAKVIQESGAVTVQAAEGDDLSYLEIKLGTGSGTVRTVGGYTSFSRQTIERSKVAILDTGLRWMGIQYAVAFELYVRTFLLALPTAGQDSTNLIALGAAGKPDTAGEWISVAMDAAWAIEDNSKGLSADVMVVSRDVAKSIALIEDSTGRPVFNLNGDGANTWPGSFDTSTLELVGSINRKPIVCVPQLPNGYAALASRDAITTMESAGAPFSLQDENIINLTKDFSLYGYQGIYSEQPKGITRITWDA